MLRSIWCLLLLSPTTVMASSLLGYWNFDDGIIDLSAASTYSISNEVSLEPSLFGRSARLSSADSFIEVSNAQALQLGAGSFTISLWIKPEDNNGYSSLVTKMDNNSVGFGLGITSTSGSGWSVSATISDATNNPTTCNNCGGEYGFEEWHHIALIYDLNELKLFVNGNLDWSVVGTQLSSINNNSSLFIGALDANMSASSETFKGLIDEVKILDNVLSTFGVQREADLINQTSTNSRIGELRFSDSNETVYQRNVVYQAETDLFVSFFQGGNGCSKNLSAIKVGDTANHVQKWLGRVTGFTSASAIIKKGEYWQVDHYSRYSSCNVTIHTRAIF